MPEADGLRRVLPTPIRELPADLVAVILIVGMTILAVFLPGLKETPLRVVFGLPFLIFVPGYALIAALFPDRGKAARNGDDGGTLEEVHRSSNNKRGIDGIERVALSFGLSIAVVPLIGLALNFTPWGIRLIPVVVGVSIFTLLMTGVATKRRLDLPSDERFSVDYREWYAAIRAELLEPETSAESALNVLLVISLLLAVGSVGYVLAAPNQGEPFTEFYLLTENDQGELVATDYPTDLTVGEPESLVLGIGNNEGERTAYSVVILIQEVRFQNNTTTVLRSQELDRFRTTLDNNETWHRKHTVAPEMTGEDLRLLYLLYMGDPPSNPTAENAYRELHLWVNVTAQQSSS